MMYSLTNNFCKNVTDFPEEWVGRFNWNALRCIHLNVLSTQSKIKTTKLKQDLGILVEFFLLNYYHCNKQLIRKVY